MDPMSNSGGKIWGVRLKTTEIVKGTLLSKKETRDCGKIRVYENQLCPGTLPRQHEGTSTSLERPRNRIVRRRTLTKSNMVETFDVLDGFTEYPPMEPTEDTLPQDDTSHGSSDHASSDVRIHLELDRGRDHVWQNFRVECYLVLNRGTLDSKPFGRRSPERSILIFLFLPKGRRSTPNTCKQT